MSATPWEYPFSYPSWLEAFFMPPDEAVTATVIVAAPLFALATKQPAPPHDWTNRIRVAPQEAPSGREQFEKRCLRCRLVRITIMGEVIEPRAYRLGEDGAQFFSDVEPECVPVAADVGCRS